LVVVSKRKKMIASCWSSASGAAVVGRNGTGRVSVEKVLRIDSMGERERE